MLAHSNGFFAWSLLSAADGGLERHLIDEARQLATATFLESACANQRSAAHCQIGEAVVWRGGAALIAIPGREPLAETAHPAPSPTLDCGRYSYTASSDERNGGAGGSLIRATPQER